MRVGLVLEALYRRKLNSVSDDSSTYPNGGFEPDCTVPRDDQENDASPTTFCLLTLEKNYGQKYTKQMRRGFEHQCKTLVT